MKLIVMDFSDPNSIREISDTEAKDYDQAYVFELKYREQVLEVVKERQRLKKEYDDSMKLVYQLRNKITLEKLAEQK